MLIRAVTEESIDLSKFTRDARIAIENARQSQTAHDDPYIRTDDLLAGVAATNSNAGMLLTNRGITFKVAVYRSERVTNDFHRVREPFTERINNPLESGKLSEYTYRIFEDAENLANSLGVDLIGTEHLLYATLRDSEGAIKFLREFKFDIEPIRSEAKELLTKKNGLDQV